MTNSNKKSNIVFGVFGTPVNRWSKKFDLKDGGACVFIDGELKMAISEERINRVKHSTGFQNAVNYCLAELKIQEEDIDIISISNCCDYTLNPTNCSSEFISRNINKVRFVESHHLSHAALAAVQSGFEESLILVADNEGNIINDDNDKSNYWNNSLERVSIYQFKNGKLSLLERNCHQIDNIGLGDTYHYFTHYLGWDSYTQAGRVMGLSAYGDKSKYSNSPIWKLNSDQEIQTLIENNRLDKFSSIYKYGHSANAFFPGFRQKNEPILKEHMDIAAWIQSELNRILSEKISLLVAKTGIKNICISGGIGYNCIANRSVLDSIGVEEIFIPYAPGDEGQPLGNAIIELLKKYKSQEIKLGNNPFLGKQYNDESIISAIKQNKIKTWKKIENIEFETAKLLAAKKMIGWFQGRSEMGSRALGNRCVLADPRFLEMKDRVNLLKGREWYRPVAPSVLEEFKTEYFDIKMSVPFMNVGANVLPSVRKSIPAVTHADGSARIQTVSKDFNPRFHSLITEFYKLTGVPILINTSFNMNGESLVETPNDAIRTFKKMNLDYLIIENYIISKN